MGSLRQFTSVCLVTAIFFLLSPRVVAEIPRANANDGRSTPPNVVIVLFDSLRADHLGCYGYDRPTSPFMDTLAREGVRFERAYAASSFTRESVASLFTGLLPSRGQHGGWGAAPQKQHSRLAEMFRQAGYATGLFSNSIMIRSEGFLAGFERHEFLSDMWSVSGTGPELTKEALEHATAAQKAGRPFFMYCHYMDPHGPYEPPKDFRERIGVPKPAEKIYLYSDVRPNIVRLLRTGFGPREPRFEDMVARYDAEIAHSDYSARLLADGLEELGELDNTIVIATSDHGEEFLEHGYVEHAWTLYEESIRVPLILWSPERLKPGIVETPVSLVDVLPTLISWLDLGALPPSDGAAWLEAGQGEIGEIQREAPIISELRIQYRNMLSAVIGPRWKYISVQKWVRVPFRNQLLKNQQAVIEAHRKGERVSPDLHSEPMREEWYDLDSDPGEQEAGKGEMPEAVVRLKRALQAYKGRCSSDAEQVEVAPPDSEEEREALKSLGYL